MDSEDSIDLQSIRTASSLTIRTPNLHLLEHASRELKQLRVLQPSWDERIVPLDAIRFCTEVRDLYISGPVSGLESIAHLRKLKKLHLWDLKIPDPGFFSSLHELQALNITTCSVQQLDHLASLESLTQLTLRNLRSVRSLGFLSALSNLRSLYLDALPKITTLKDVVRCVTLERLVMEAMNNVVDFTPLLDMKSLNEFYLGNVRGRQPEDFFFLLVHSSLKKVGIFLGSERKNNQLKERFEAHGIEFTKCSSI